MTIFAVLLPRAQPALVSKIANEFGMDALGINDLHWLVSGSGTASEITARLGITNPAEPNDQPVGEAIVFATNGYFGRAPANVWEWIKVKLEAPSRAAGG